MHNLGRFLKNFDSGQKSRKILTGPDSRNRYFVIKYFKEALDNIVVLFWKVLVVIFTENLHNFPRIGFSEKSKITFYFISKFSGHFYVKSCYS